MRALHLFELDFLRQALEVGGRGLTPQHLDEALAVEVCPEDLDYYHIQLIYPDGTQHGRLWTPIREWNAKDSDGAVIEILAFSDERGRMQELEMHRVDCQPIRRVPTLEASQPVRGYPGQDAQPDEGAA